MDMTALNDRIKATLNKGGFIKSLLAVGAILCLLLCIYIVAFVKVPPGTTDALMIIIGIIGAVFKDVYGYYFGSSAGSDKKTDIIAQSQPVDGTGGK